MAAKLYKVTVKGLVSSRDPDYHEVYVLAENSSEACDKYREYLNEYDVGFDSERSMGTIELIADSEKYPECGKFLFL